jgi:signal transduction histidine kinase
VDVRVDETVSPPPAVAVALYRIAQEALNNVVKHAAAGRATVTLHGAAGDDHTGVELTVADDGCGFDVDDVRSGRLGLGIMAERAESIGARLELRSAAGQGTAVRVLWSP